MNIEIINKIDKFINSDIYILGFKLDEYKKIMILFYKRTNKTHKLTSKLLKSLDEFSFLSHESFMHDSKTSSISTDIYEVTLQFETDEEIKFIKNVRYEKVYLYWKGILKNNFINDNTNISLTTFIKISKYINCIFINYCYNNHNKHNNGLYNIKNRIIFLEDIK